MDITIGITSHNVRNLIERCIDSIYSLNSQLNYEIIVVDNNSQDETVKFLKQKYPEIKVIENKKDMGFAYANNQAIKVANGRYYFMLSSDTIVMPETIDALVKFMEGQPDVGVLAPKLLNEDMTIQRSCKTFFNLKIAFFIDTILGTIFPNIERKHRMIGFNYDKIMEVDQPMGTALLLRSETIKDAGLLDERFFFFFEDVDWCYRIKNHGWKIYFFSDANIIHSKGNLIEIIDNKEQFTRILLWHKGKYKYLEKYNPWIFVTILRIFVLISSLIFILKWLIISIFTISNHKKELMSYYTIIRASLA